jgi:hypothetical protein
MHDQLVTVETYQFLPQAQAAKLQLEGHEIKVFLADAETVNMDWLLGNAIGNIKLQVPRDQVDKALGLLEEMRDKASYRQDTDDEDEETVCLACGAEIPEDEACCPSCGWSYVVEENGAPGTTRQVSGQDLSEAKPRPLAMKLFRALKEPFLWLLLTPTVILIFWLVSAFLGWLLRVD